jgi:hypothetical protein
MNIKLEADRLTSLNKEFQRLPVITTARELCLKASNTFVKKLLALPTASKEFLRRAKYRTSILDSPEVIEIVSRQLSNFQQIAVELLEKFDQDKFQRIFLMSFEPIKKLELKLGVYIDQNKEELFKTRSGCMWDRNISLKMNLEEINNFSLLENEVKKSLKMSDLNQSSLVSGLSRRSDFLWRMVIGAHYFDEKLSKKWRESWSDLFVEDRKSLEELLIHIPMSLNVDDFEALDEIHNKEHWFYHFANAGNQERLRSIVSRATEELVFYLNQPDEKKALDTSEEDKDYEWRPEGDDDLNLTKDCQCLKLFGKTYRIPQNNTNTPILLEALLCEKRIVRPQDRIAKAKDRDRTYYDNFIKSLINFTALSERYLRSVFHFDGVSKWINFKKPSKSE